MATKIRPELSKRNKYYISKHRYYELKHFCLQYKEWKRAYDILEDEPLLGDLSDPTGDCASTKIKLKELMGLIEQAAWDADREIGSYILEAVVEERPYEYFKMMKNIPCGRDMFYDRRRKFFWILDKRR